MSAHLVSQYDAEDSSLTIDQFLWARKTNDLGLSVWQGFFFYNDDKVSSKPNCSVILHPLFHPCLGLALSFINDVYPTMLP